MENSFSPRRRRGRRVSDFSCLRGDGRRQEGALFVNFGCKLDNGVKSRKTPLFVIPAKAGIQYFRALAESLDSGLRRNDDFLRCCQTYTLNTLNRRFEEQNSPAQRQSFSNGGISRHWKNTSSQRSPRLCGEVSLLWITFHTESIISIHAANFPHSKILLFPT